MPRSWSGVGRLPIIVTRTASVSLDLALFDSEHDGERMTAEHPPGRPGSSSLSARGRVPGIAGEEDQRHGWEIAIEGPPSQRCFE